MKKLNKGIALVLSLVMALSVMCVSAFATTDDDSVPSGSLTVYVGSGANVTTAEFSDEDDVCLFTATNYVSSNKEIATVNGIGYVAGIATGEATITVYGQGDEFDESDESEETISEETIIATISVTVKAHNANDPAIICNADGMVAMAVAEEGESLQGLLNEAIGTVTYVGTYAGAVAFKNGESRGAAQVDETTYETLAAAVDAASAGDTVTLLDDVTLDTSIHVTKPIVINGNGKTLTLTHKFTPNAGNAFFDDFVGTEGIINNLTVSDLTMRMTSDTRQGYAAVVGKGSTNFNVVFDKCTFENMYCGVLPNGCGGTVAPNITVSNCTFTDVDHGLSFAFANYVETVTFTNNTMTGETDIQDVWPGNTSGYLTAPTVTVTDGKFSSDVSNFLTSGYRQLTSAEYGFAAGQVVSDTAYNNAVNAYYASLYTDDDYDYTPAAPATTPTVEIEEEATPLAALPESLSDVTVTITNEAGEEIEVTAAELPNVYADVDDNSWARDAIAYANALGLMNGVGNDENGEASFDPQGTTTSEMLTTVLFRAVSGETTSGENWADDALAWAADANLTEGLGLEEGKDVTREQMVTMMYRIALAKGFDVSAANGLEAFPDADGLSDFAADAMAWAVSVGLINGMDGQLNGAGSVTREQIATILMRFNEMTKDVA